MKQILGIIMASLISATGFTQNFFFPSQEGMTLEYADKNAKDKVTGYVTYRIHKVDRQDDKNFTVNYLVSTADNRRKEVLAGIDVTVKVVDGTVYFDGSSVMANLVETIKIKGNGITIPSDIQVGQKLDDFSISIDAMPVSTSCTDIIVAAEEKLSTEAGNFDTYRINMQMAGKALFVKTEGTITQWYAKGIGEIKTVNYDKKGKVLTIRELVGLKR